jgi:3-dehydroquinate dehydratase / shikimate dehydrogenase
MTLVCVSILVHDESAALADALAARDAGADVVEFRVDEFFTGDDPQRETVAIIGLLARCPLPSVLTCRISAEGGGFAGDEADRIAMFERAANPSPKRVFGGAGESIAEHPPRYIDVEHSAFMKSANIRQKVHLAVDHPGQLRDLQTGLILSMHDFEGRPLDLHRRLMAMSQERSAAVVKVAFRARSLRDNLELLDLPRVLNRPTIALAMGKFGLMSRVLAPKFGGFMTYASLRHTHTTAPGQPTVHELLHLFRLRSIRATTSVYGIVGWPLEHSLSPLLHNAGFEALGFDGVYVPMPIAADEADPDGSYASFKATMLDLLGHSSLDFRGCSVTIPHKEHLVRLAAELGWSIDAGASTCGAANTLVVRPDRVEVLNTDAPATAQVMRGALRDLAGRTILVLGAGGMARAAAFACLHADATVLIHNRSPARARQLVESFGERFAARVRAIDAASAQAALCDAVINCTSVGMVGGPSPHGVPIDLSAVAAHSPNVVVVDAVYKPRRTPLLARAQSLGLRTVDGIGLLVAQAALQCKAWTGSPAPVSVFERVLAEDAHAGKDGS